MKQVREALAVGLACLTLCCDGSKLSNEKRSPSHDDPVVATFDGGTIALSEVEARLPTARGAACVAVRRPAAAVAIDDLVACYREVAQELLLERMLLRELGDVDRAIETLDEYQELHHHALLSSFFDNLRRGIEIEDAEIERYYENNPDRFRRPAQLTLWTLFRRHEDPEDRQATIAFMQDLRLRCLAGEAFETLARAYSHSETRLRGGLVGPVSTGRLPPRLEEIAFALDEGGVSEPIEVRDGAVLLHARHVVEAVELSLHSARESIRRQLIQEQIDGIVADRVAERPIQAGSVDLTPDELLRALDGDDSQLVVLDIVGVPLNVQGLRRLAGIQQSVSVSELADEQLTELQDIYETQRNHRLLVRDLLESADPVLEEQVAEHVRREGVARLVDRSLLDGMRQLVDADQENLRNYWRDNRHHYQSPLQFKIQLLSLPFDADPPRQLRHMERFSEELAAGNRGFDDAAAELGGTIRSLGWRDLDSLEEDIPHKAVSYLVQIGDTGYSPPFQQNEALHLIWLQDRREPAVQEYEAVLDQVREDYLQRFQRQLLDQALARRLSNAGFDFMEDAVRLSLAPPGEAQS